MKRPILTAAVLLTLCANVRSQTTQPAIEPDVASFELTPVAPPTPAMKYQFYFGYSDRIPGNAAPLILDAVLLMGPTASETANKANNAYSAGDFKTFDKLADSLDGNAIWGELDQAMRRLDSDFSPPLRQMAELTMLPHLQSIRSIAWVIKARALRQLEQGKVDDALATIRLGYELSDKITEPVIVSALVSAGCTRLVNEITLHVMNDPHSPNLYWALANIPSRYPILRKSWDAETEWLFVGHPSFAKVHAGEEPTPEQWRKIMVDEMAGFWHLFEDYNVVGERPHPDPIKDAPPELLNRARQDYVESHHVSADQAAKTDPAILLGHYYYRQWRLAADDVGKLRGLPYHAILARTKDLTAVFDRLKREQPTNPFLQFLTEMHRATYSFARADREVAALTAVEALRSYAAAHDGTLPVRLDAVQDTPVPLNPATGQPFEYRLESGTAILSDTKSESALTYTLKIRK